MNPSGVENEEVEFVKVSQSVARLAQPGGGVVTRRPLPVARIYLRRRSDKERSGIFGRFFRPSLARYLAEEALITITDRAKGT
jgi:hypothetical protein